MFGATAGINGEHQAEEVVEGMADARISQFVACSTAFGKARDEAAPTQTGQVVGDELAGNADVVG